jgi:hypothetical protein
MALVAALLICGVSLLLRCSELGGAEIQAACRGAVMVTGLAGLVGLIPVIWKWGASGYQILVAVFTGAVIRFLISAAGIVIILRFTAIQPLWLVVFFVLSYVFFLLIETAVTIWLLKTITWNN